MQFSNKCKILAQHLQIVPARQKKHRGIRCEYHFYSIRTTYDSQNKRKNQCKSNELHNYMCINNMYKRFGSYLNHHQCGSENKHMNI